MLKYLLMVAVCTYAAAQPSCGQAAELHVAVHGASKHSSPGFNETHPGAGVGLTVGKLTTEAGVYRNSYNRTSFYNTVSYMPLAVGNVKLGVMGGLATGYQNVCGKVVCPIAALQANVGVSSRVDLVLRWVPPYPNAEKGVSVGTVSVQFTF